MNNREVVLGVDIGGTNTVMGYVDRQGDLLAESTIPTEAQRPAQEFFNRLHTNAEKLLNSISEKIQLVGV